METKFNFNSQICTNKIQSIRLLALGIKKETADMCWIDHALTDDYEDWRETPIYKDWKEWQRDGIPAWSLGRLIEMLPTLSRLAKIYRPFITMLSFISHRCRWVMDGNIMTEKKEYLQVSMVMASSQP